jgi:tetratricopeptide (TPR) repeat protein
MEPFTRKRAKQLFDRGMDAVSKGNFHVARESFRSSAELFATAEAVTFWGWMEFQLGDAESAIRLCQRAIAIDPDFGNPYNDIGSYLISQGKIDEATEWLEKAKQAKRYDARHYPHMNLARIYTVKGMPVTALGELEEARQLAPLDTEVLKMIDAIRLVLN